jgi:serine/threonine-protein kinase
LANLKALYDAGKYQDALPDARGVGLHGLAGEALLRYGELQGRDADLDGAGKTLERAALEADVAADDRTRARALTGLLFFVSSEQAKFDLASPYRDRAAAALDRLGGDDRLRADLDHALGTVFARQGKWDEAQRLAEHELALVQKLYPEASAEVASATNSLGVAYLYRAETDRALETLSRALALAEKALGPHHPLLGLIYANLGVAYSDKEDPAASVRALRSALAINEASLGADHPRNANALDGLGGALIDLGDFAGAISTLERALAIRERSLRPDHPSFFYTHRALGRAYVGLGNARAAIPHLERALALSKEVGAPELADTQFSLAQALTMAGRGGPGARALAMKARDLLAEHAIAASDKTRLAEMNAWLARGK